MTPGHPDATTCAATDLFRERPDNLLNQSHALCRLAGLIKLSVFDKEFGSLYCPDNGCPGKSMWLMAGLQYLKHCYGLSDEAVVQSRAAKASDFRRVIGTRIDEAFVDKGYRGHGETVTTMYISGQKRGITTQRLKRSLKRCQAIEPVIGHLKADGLLRRNHLKGAEGDQINVLLSCAGHNLRLILNGLRHFCLEAAMRLRACLHRYPAPRRLSWLPATSMTA